ncbi:hypothetical protein ACLKA7_016095 [Drosophila subpalustris]
MVVSLGLRGVRWRRLTLGGDREQGQQELRSSCGVGVDINAEVDAVNEDFSKALQLLLLILCCLDFDFAFEVEVGEAFKLAAPASMLLPLSLPLLVTSSSLQTAAVLVLKSVVGVLLFSSLLTNVTCGRAKLATKKDNIDNDNVF